MMSYYHRKQEDMKVGFGLIIFGDGPISRIVHIVFISDRNKDEEQTAQLYLIDTKCQKSATFYRS